MTGPAPLLDFFKKGEVLYRFSDARKAASASGRGAAARGLVIVEGYMDAISLAEAGIEEVVAPLGTALTEDQVRLLWRLAPEPILCFDGDSAGQKAAYRAIETVLPILSPGHSLRFAFLPNGLDPDDLIRTNGPEAMQDVLGRTQALVDVLWDREWRSGEWSTPERRAQLERGSANHWRRRELQRRSDRRRWRDRAERWRGRRKQRRHLGGGCATDLPLSQSHAAG